MNTEVNFNYNIGDIVLYEGLPYFVIDRRYKVKYNKSKKLCYWGSGEVFESVGIPVVYELYTISNTTETITVGVDDLEEY